HRRRRTQPGQPAADAGGAVPAPVRAWRHDTGRRRGRWRRYPVGACGGGAMSTFAGSGRLVRLILRRDRVVLPLWVLFCGRVPALLAASIVGLFPTADGQRRYAEESMGNAAFTTLYGRLSGTSLGELTAWRAGFVPVVVGLAALLMVVRHTRAEEEAG